MKIWIKLRLVVMVGILSMGWFSSLTHSQTQEFLFTYISYNYGNLSSGLTLNKVEPATGNLQTTWTIPAAGTELIDAQISPDGIWLSLIWGDGTDRSIELHNMITEERRTVAQNLIFSEMLSYAPQRPGLLSWAENSNQFAFNAVDAQSADTDIYVYSIHENELINLTADSRTQFDFTWSNSSDVIAVNSAACDHDQSICLEGSLDIISLDHQIIVTAVDLSAFPTVPISGFIDICNLSFSPTDTLISFISTCDPTSPGAAKEIYVARISDNTIANITNFTPQDVNHFELAFSTEYDVYWQDDRLLVGYIYDISTRNQPQQNLVEQTFLYDFALGASLQLSDARQSHWVTIPGYIAYQLYDYPNDGNGVPPANNIGIRISEFDGSSISDTVFEATSGCNPLWSPNHIFLSYEDRGNPTQTCSGSINRLAFEVTP